MVEAEAVSDCPLAQGLKGGGPKEHRHGAPTPSSWWGLGGRGPWRSQRRQPGSSGGGGHWASVGSEAPSQGLPQGQRDSLALGRMRCPRTEKGALTQPSQAHRAAVPGSLPVAVGEAVGAGGRVFSPCPPGEVGHVSQVSS